MSRNDRLRKPLLLMALAIMMAIAATEDYLRACAESQMDYVQHLKVVVDGVTLIDASAANSPYEAESKVFTFVAASNNLFGVPAGRSNSMADGFYAMVAPLEQGQHTIEFVGAADFTAAGGGPYAPGATYNITVN